MHKRSLDLLLSSALLVVTLPVTLPVLLAVWMQDGHSPFYVATRVGKDGKPFRMIKVRSMVIGADRSGVDSTKTDDPRISAVGGFVRRLKLDELGQLLNVIRGDMSLVGPRPQVQRDVELYTDTERYILQARPGITDFASIVFADEGDILKGSADPDLRYNQVIRPWKSRLALFYLEQDSLLLDIQLIAATAMAAVSRGAALSMVNRMLIAGGASPQLIGVARREVELVPHPPPGAESVVTSRQCSAP